MTKAERSALLRVRMLAVRGYALPPYPKAKPKPKEPPRKPLSINEFARRNGSNVVPTKFVMVPDPKPALVLRTKRTARPSPLNTIAEKWRKFAPR